MTHRNRSVYLNSATRASVGPFPTLRAWRWWMKTKETKP